MILETANLKGTFDGLNYIRSKRPMLKEDQIKAIADSLLPVFLPKDETATELSFNFTVPPKETYKVWYLKNKKKWEILKYEKVQI